MGDAAGELADGFHLLRLLQLCLESASLGRLGHEHADADRRALRQGDRKAARTQLTLDATLSFGAAQQLHVDDGLPLVEHTPKQRLAFFAKLWLELTDELSNVRRGGLSIELSKRVIHAQIAKLAVEQRESDRRARDDHIEEG